MKTFRTTTLMFSGTWFCLASAMAQPVAAPVAPAMGVAPMPMGPIFSAPTITRFSLEEALGGPTTLKLRLQDATLSEIAAEIERQSGLPIQAPPSGAAPGSIGEGARFSVEATGQPFWEALYEWSRVARAQAKAKGGSRLNATREGALPVALPGAPAAITAPAVRTGPTLAGSSLPPGLLGTGSMMRVPRRSTLLSVAAPNMTQRTGGRYWLDANAMPEGRAVSAWPCFLLASQIERGQSAALPDDEGSAATWNDSLNVRTAVYFDPKLTLLRARCDVLEATDDKGQDLRLPDAGRGRLSVLNLPMFNRVNAAQGQPLMLQLQSQPQMGRKLTKLRGMLHLLLVARTQQWEITDLQKPLVRDFAGKGFTYQLRFDGLERDENGIRVKLSASARVEQPLSVSGAGPRMGIEDFQLLSAITDKMQVADDKGQAFEARTERARLSLGNRQLPAQPGGSPPVPGRQQWDFSENVSLSLGAPSFLQTQGEDGKPLDHRMGQPVSLVMNIPTDVREVSIPFEFSNLPLPPS